MKRREAQVLYDKLHAELLKNVAYDNRLEILDLLRVIVLSKDIDMQKALVGHRRKDYNTMLESIGSHLKLWDNEGRKTLR